MTPNMLVAGLLALVIVAALVLVGIQIYHPKWPKPQDPPSDKSRLDAIKRDWEEKP